jgi:hypothetical protein
MPSCISGGVYAGRIARVQLLQGLHKPAIAQLDVVADQEQVLRLDVEVRQLVFAIENIQRLGHIVEVRQQLVARDARVAARLPTIPDRVQVLFGQLHDDEEIVADQFDAVGCQNQGMTNVLDAVERQRLQVPGGRLGSRAAKVVEDELEGFVSADGGRALPDLSKPAAAEALDQPVTRKGFGVGLTGRAEPARPGWPYHLKRLHSGTPPDLPQPVGALKGSSRRRSGPIIPTQKPLFGRAILAAVELWC